MSPANSYARRVAVACAIGLAAIIGVVVLAPSAAASSTNPSSSPAASYGKIALAALTATRIPDSGLFDRNGIQVTNLDTARIWCGWNSSVTDATGTPVEPNGGKQSWGISYQTQTQVSLWCYSVAGQTSPADTRYSEVR